ncbi:hypothetical protein F2Q70_00003887 [Brassica cretica]|uniref:Uncharacterized protein n=1 Tax=Brassica cretica TaxID=69181 RepID=A0A8S9IVY7_BRACR|nr:hypothetical protein F2Q70_00003887 [Brassica cretica]
MLSQSFHVRPVFQDGTWDVSRVAHWFDHSTYIEWFDGLTTRRTSSGSLVRSLDVRRVARWFDHPMYVSSHSTYVGWFYGLITRCTSSGSTVCTSTGSRIGSGGFFRACFRTIGCLVLCCG